MVPAQLGGSSSAQMQPRMLCLTNRWLLAGTRSSIAHCAHHAVVGWKGAHQSAGALSAIIATIIATLWPRRPIQGHGSRLSIICAYGQATTGCQPFIRD